MWGVLIFLRFYYIVGQSGIYEALLVVMISFIAAFLTTISLSAIVTSGSGLKNGGPYYMISRSLGPYIGVSIGIVYYFGIMLLGVLEVLGAVETIHYATDFHYPGSTQIYTIICMIMITLLIHFGSKIVSKLGIVFFGVVIVTILFFYLGLALAPFNAHPGGLTGLDATTFEDNLEPDHTEGSSFSVSLAIFFPTFAAIFSGADRSKKL
jgi:potassium/chloride transporter 4/5/6